MKSPQKRHRARFELEPLEGRVALSHMGAVVEDGPHRNRGGHAEVHTLRQGADDPANHDANDDNGGAGEAVHQHRGGRAATAVHGRHHGADDPAGHK